MIDTEALRKKVIDLAIQGKLTVQLPEDGKAEDLFALLQEEKAKLFKEGKIKKEKPLQEITDDETPFELPSNWCWVRLGDYSQKITDMVASGSFASIRDNVPTLKEPSYALMVKTADFANGFTENLTYTNKHGYEFLSNSNLFGGELILSNIGSIGKCFIVPKLEHKMTLAPNAIMIRLTDNALRDYLYYFLLSTSGLHELEAISTGTTVKKFNKTDLKKIVIPVPPLKEQNRIVEKINDILANIDIIDNLQQQYKADYEVLKGKIIDAGIRGKLTEQLSEDGNSDYLYAQIMEEKARLLKEGKIKREKPLPEISDDEIPFEIPENWKWVRFGALYSLTNGIASRGTTGGIPRPVLRLADLKDGEINTEGIRMINLTDSEFDSHKICAGDIVFIRVNGSRDKVANAFLYYEQEEIAYCDHLFSGRKICEQIDSAYIMLVYRSDLVKKQVDPEIKTTAGQNTVNQSGMSKILIPLPPYSEQKRIVEKTSKLFRILAQL